MLKIEKFDTASCKIIWKNNKNKVDPILYPILLSFTLNIKIKKKHFQEFVI